MSDVPLSAGDTRRMWAPPDTRRADAPAGSESSAATIAEPAAPTDAAAAAPDTTAAASTAAPTGAVPPSASEVPVNPEVPAAAVPPPPPAVGWAPAAWDASGYVPPDPVRLDEHGAAGYPADAAAATAYPAVFAPVGAVGAVAAPAAPAAPATPVTKVPYRRSRVQLRSSITVLLFVAGLVLGVGLVRMAIPAHPSTPDGLPTLDRTAVEPAQASAVAQELAQNDVHGLAQLLDSTTLTAIQSQLKPLVTFESVTYVGAITQGKDTVAGYVVRGRDQDGNLGLVGLVIRLRDGQVVAQ